MWMVVSVCLRSRLRTMRIEKLLSEYVIRTKSRWLLTARPAETMPGWWLSTNQWRGCRVLRCNSLKICAARGLSVAKTAPCSGRDSGRCAIAARIASSISGCESPDGIGCDTGRGIGTLRQEGVEASARRITRENHVRIRCLQDLNGYTSPTRHSRQPTPDDDARANQHSRFRGFSAYVWGNFLQREGRWRGRWWGRGCTGAVPTPSDLEPDRAGSRHRCSLVQLHAAARKALSVSTRYFLPFRSFPKPCVAGSSPAGGARRLCGINGLRDWLLVDCSDWCFVVASLGMNGVTNQSFWATEHHWRRGQGERGMGSMFPVRGSWTIGGAAVGWGE